MTVSPGPTPTTKRRFTRTHRAVGCAVFMGLYAIRTHTGGGDRLNFSFYRGPRDSRSTEPELVTLKCIVGPGDDADPVMTILLLNED